MNDQHSPSIRDSVTTEDWGSYNVIAVSFKEDNNAYAALSQLKELDSQGRIRLDEASVVERLEDGQVVEKDQVDSSFPTITIGAGLTGLLVGIIGGPLGMLIGGTSGLLAGSLVDLGDLDETGSALSQISSSAKVGHTTLLAEVAEKSPDVIDAEMDDLGGTVLRRSVADVTAEIAAAEDAERKAKHEAREELMRAHREQNNEAVHAKVEELKGKLSGTEKTPRQKTGTSPSHEKDVAAEYDAHLTHVEDSVEGAAEKSEASFREHTAGAEAKLEKAEDDLEAAARKVEAR